MAPMNTGHSPVANEVTSGDAQYSDLLGFSIVSLVPAVFWMMVLTGVGRMAGWELGAEIIAMTGLAIAAFLAGVFNILRNHSI
jgi:low affinity Fe/Cu permease